MESAKKCRTTSSRLGRSWQVASEVLPKIFANLQGKITDKLAQVAAYIRFACMKRRAVFKEHKAPIWCQSTGARISLKSGSLMCCSLQISTFMWAQCMQRWIGKLECSFIIYSKLWGWAWPVLSKLNEFGTTSITISKEPVQHDLLGWQDLATPGPSLAPNHLSTSHHVAHLLLQFADLAIHCTLSFVRITADRWTMGPSKANFEGTAYNAIIYHDGLYTTVLTAFHGFHWQRE